LGGEGLSKVQEWMEKALRAEATLEVVTRERDTAQASLAAGGGQPEPPSTAKRRTTSYDSDEEDDLRVRIHLQFRNEVKSMCSKGPNDNAAGCDAGDCGYAGECDQCAGRGGAQGDGKAEGVWGVRPQSVATCVRVRLG